MSNYEWSIMVCGWRNNHRSNNGHKHHNICARDFRSHTFTNRSANREMVKSFNLKSISIDHFQYHSMIPWFEYDLSLEHRHKTDHLWWQLHSGGIEALLNPLGVQLNTLLWLKHPWRVWWLCSLVSTFVCTRYTLHKICIVVIWFV